MISVTIVLTTIGTVLAPWLPSSRPTVSRQRWGAWRWYSVADGGPGIGDDDPWTMRLAIVALIVWAVVGARLFGLV